MLGQFVALWLFVHPTSIASAPIPSCAQTFGLPLVLPCEPVDGSGLVVHHESQAAPAMIRSKRGATEDLRSYLLAMEDAYAGVRDYSATLYKQERVKGRLLPREVMHVKFRKPYSIYVKWVGTEHAGQEALYVRGKHQGKMRAHPGSFPDVTVSLDPRGALAMRNNRHPITEASLGDIIALVVRDIRRADKGAADEVGIQDHGTSDRRGERVRCLEARFAGEGYYATRVQICTFIHLRLPSHIRVWDAKGRLLEDYEYRDLKVNVGLKDGEFDERYPGYRF